MTDASTAGAFLITFAVLQTLAALILIRLLDLYEHEPLSTLAVMVVWGAVGATALSAVGNGIGNQVLLSYDPVFADVFGPAVIAPAVEELAKGIALVAAFGFSAWASTNFGTKRLRGLTDGLMYGFAVGLGFAFTEDVKYLFDVAASGDFAKGISIFTLRRDFIGIGMIQHGVFTGIFGVGVGLATWANRWWWKVILPTISLFLAMLIHAFNNGFVEFRLTQKYGLETARDWILRASSLGLEKAASNGKFPTDIVETHRAAALTVSIGAGVITLLLLVMAVLWLRFQRKVIKGELPAEVESGLINGRDWELVPSFWRRVLWYLDLIRVREFERMRVFRKLHIELANLALLKWRAARSRSKIDRKEVAASRQRVANLKAEIRVDVYAPG